MSPFLSCLSYTVLNCPILNETILYSSSRFLKPMRRSICILYQNFVLFTNKIDKHQLF
nr:MAG TPA: hypothetical protein [Caudoviricetes sp.]